MQAGMHTHTHPLFWFLLHFLTFLYTHIFSHIHWKSFHFILSKQFEYKVIRFSFLQDKVSGFVWSNKHLLLTDTPTSTSSVSPASHRCWYCCYCCTYLHSTKAYHRACPYQFVEIIQLPLFIYLRFCIPYEYKVNDISMPHTFQTHYSYIWILFYLLYSQFIVYFLSFVSSLSLFLPILVSTILLFAVIIIL